MYKNYSISYLNIAILACFPKDLNIFDLYIVCMVKKKDTNDWKKIITGTASKIFKDKLEDFASNFKQKIHNTIKIVVEKILSTILMLIAFIFLTVAFTYYLIEYQDLTKTLAFLITAGVVFLFSFVVMYKSKK